MALLVSEAKVKLYWLTAVSNIAAPTTAEISAGTQLSAFLSKDGINVTFNQNMVDVATIVDTYDSQVVGSVGVTVELTMFRSDTTETAWNLFVRGTNGYLLISRFGTPSTSTPTNKVEVYPAQMHDPVPMAPAANEAQKFTVNLAVTSSPNLKATITV